MPGRIREVIIYFKFHENQSRGLGAVGGVENRPLSLTRPMAYTTARTVQAVIGRSRVFLMQVFLTYNSIAYFELEVV